MQTYIEDISDMMDRRRQGPRRNRCKRVDERKVEGKWKDIGKPAEVWWTRGRPVVWWRLTRLYFSQSTRGRRWRSVLYLSAALIVCVWACIHFLNLHICVLLVLISILLAIIITLTPLICLVLVFI
jgi:hypothetical protein